MIKRDSYQAAQPLMQWVNLLSNSKRVRLLMTPPWGKRGSLNCQKYPSALQKLIGRSLSWFKTPQSTTHYVSYFFTESFRQSKWSTEAHTRQPSPSCNEAICSAKPNGCAFGSRHLVAKGDPSIAKNIRQLCRNRWRGWIGRIFVAAWQIGRSQRGGRGCQPSCVGTWSEPRKKASKYAYATPLGEQT